MWKEVNLLSTNFSAKHTTSATLTITVIYLLTSIDTLKLLIVSVRLHSHTNESICIFYPRTFKILYNDK